MNSKQQTDLQKSWYEAAMKSCFPEADDAFRHGAGFSNPVSQSFWDAMTVLLPKLTEEQNLEAFRAPLDRIVRVLAVQGLPPGSSIRFLFVLRNLLDAAPYIMPEEKQFLFKRIDDLAEISVEIWCECRETLSQLRINELRNRIRQLEAGSTPKERGGLPDGQNA